MREGQRQVRAKETMGMEVTDKRDWCTHTQCALRKVDDGTGVAAHHPTALDSTHDDTATGVTRR